MTATIELPIINEHGIPVMEDFQIEFHRRSNAEIAAKIRANDATIERAEKRIKQLLIEIAWNRRKLSRLDK